MASEGWFTLFVNCRLCINGQLVHDQIVFSQGTGNILKRTGYIGGEIVDLDGAIVAPGLLQVIGRTKGEPFEFAGCTEAEHYQQRLEDLARGSVKRGVTGFWIALDLSAFHEIAGIPHLLEARTFDDGAAFMGFVVVTGQGKDLDPIIPGDHVRNACSAARGSSTEMAGMSIAEAIKSVTESPATFMGEAGPEGRGVLAEGKRADFVVLTEDGIVLETWIGGTKIWSTV